MKKANFFKGIMGAVAVAVFGANAFGNPPASPTPATSGTIVLTQVSNSALWTACYNSSGGLLGYGGEFNATTTPSAGTTSATFITFCLEQAVDFTPGVTYDYTTGVALGGQTPPAGSATLSAGAAYLYMQLLDGSLGWTLGSGENSLEVTTFQDAIWQLEGETVYTNTGGVLAPNADYNLAVAHFGGNVSAALATADTSSGVLAAALTIPNTTTPAQNQLIFIPTSNVNRIVPDGASSVMLLGVALGGVALLRRKFTA